MSRMTFAQRLYHHLQRLSLSYYDTHQIGNMVSTITSDVSTIQSFASTALAQHPRRLPDHHRHARRDVLSQLRLRAHRRGGHAGLLFFISHFKKAVKKATHEVRKRQSEIVGVVEQGLQSVRSVEGLRPAGHGGGSASRKRARRRWRPRSRRGG